MITRRTFFLTPIALLLATQNGYTQPAAPWAAMLLAAARAQVDVTKFYDPAYRKIIFPGGDVPRETGVCTDVIIRAYRDAFGADIQSAVNSDMKSNFSSYPKNWGLKRPDTNIDHRRVPNLQIFFKRNGSELAIGNGVEHYKPADIVTQLLPGNLPHIAIVSDKKAPETNEPMVIHNIGQGTREEATLFTYKITGHYRWKIQPMTCFDCASNKF